MTSRLFPVGEVLAVLVVDDAPPLAEASLRSQEIDTYVRRTERATGTIVRSLARDGTFDVVNCRTDSASRVSGRSTSMTPGRRGRRGLRDWHHRGAL